MEWHQDVCIKLINEFKKREVLWNTKHNHFYAKDLKDEAWEELADLFEKSVDEIKKKIDSLKASYRRERGRVNRGYRDGTSPYESRWFAYKTFNFMHDKDELRKNSNNIESALYENESSDVDIDHLKEELDLMAEDVPPIKRKRIDNSRQAATVSNHCRIFGDFVEAKLSTFDARLQAIAQHKIHNVLFELEMSMYDQEPNFG